MDQVLAKLSPRPLARFSPRRAIFRAQSLDPDNPLKDIYDDLKEHGLYGTPETEKIRAQHPAITKGVYLIVVDWLMELCALRKLDRTVYYKTLAIFWKYLDGSMNLKADSCQCAIVACLSLASKFLTSDHLDFQELAASTDYSFTKGDICTFEKHVFHCVGFNVHGVCSTHTYLYPVFHTINCAIHDCNDFCPSLDNHELINYCTSRGVKPLNSDEETELLKLCLLVLDGLSTDSSFYNYRPIAIVLATIYAVSGWKLSLFRHMFGHFAQHLDLIRTRIHCALPSVHELGASPNELYVHRKAFWIQQLSLETQTKFVDVLNGQLVYALPIECRLGGGPPRSPETTPRRHKKVTRCANVATQVSVLPATPDGTPADSPLPTPAGSPLSSEEDTSLLDRYSDCDLFAKFKAPKRTKGVEDDDMETSAADAEVAKITHFVVNGKHIGSTESGTNRSMRCLEPCDLDDYHTAEVRGSSSSSGSGSLSSRVAQAGSYTEFVAGMKRPLPAGPKAAAADKKARRTEEEEEEDDDDDEEQQPGLVMFDDDDNNSRSPPNKTVDQIPEAFRTVKEGQPLIPKALQEECNRKLRAAVAAQIDAAGKEPYEPSQQITTESPDV